MDVVVKETVVMDVVVKETVVMDTDHTAGTKQETKKHKRK